MNWYKEAVFTSSNTHHEQTLKSQNEQAENMEINMVLVRVITNLEIVALLIKNEYYVS